MGFINAMLSHGPLPIAQLKLPCKPEAFSELNDILPPLADLQETAGSRGHLESFSSTASTCSGISPVSHLKRREKREKKERKLQEFLARLGHMSKATC